MLQKEVPLYLLVKGVVLICSNWHTKYCRLDVLNNRNFILSQFWRLKVQDQSVSRMVSLMVISLSYRWPFSLHDFTGSPRSVCTLISSYKNIIHIGQSLPIWSHFTLISSLKLLSPNSHILKHWELGLYTHVLRGNNSVHKTYQVTMHRQGRQYLNLLQ
jgi:hypothetical protein